MTTVPAATSPDAQPRIESTGLQPKHSRNRRLVFVETLLNEWASGVFQFAQVVQIVRNNLGANAYEVRRLEELSSAVDQKSVHEIILYIRDKSEPPILDAVRSGASINPAEVASSLLHFALNEMELKELDDLAHSLESVLSCIPSEASRNQTQFLGYLALDVARTEMLRGNLDMFVLAARESGATWADIGKAAGISPQAAHGRWNPGAKERHRDYQRQLRQRGKPDSQPINAEVLQVESTPEGSSGDPQ